MLIIKTLAYARGFIGSNPAKRSKIVLPLNFSENMKKKILIVDDDAMISDMYLMKFTEAGFDAITASDGKTALEKIESEKPDAVLLDIVMPQRDGFDVLKEIGKKGILGQTKIILLSNVGQREDIEKGLSLGASEYIIKANFTPSEVLEKVKKIIGA